VGKARPIRGDVSRVQYTPNRLVRLMTAPTKPGCLHIVATPIGNLEDITLRALRILREVDLIAAEDTRRTARLLQHYSISTPTTSLHEHNEGRRITALLGRLAEGSRIAVVSDAGTPTISDPGAHLVRAALDRGIRVEAVPGPSAVIAAVAASGFGGDRFVFLGFPPIRSKDRTLWFRELSEQRVTTVFFEAPHRLLRTLNEAKQYLVKRTIVVMKELSKIHESSVKGPIEAAIKLLGQPRGEYTIVVEPPIKQEDTGNMVQDPISIYREFCHMTESGFVSRREAIRQLAEAHNISSRAVYRLVEEAKNSRAKTRT